MVTMEKVLKEVGFGVDRKNLVIEGTKKRIEIQAIVRKDTKQVIGFVSKKYHIIKHNEALKGSLKKLKKEGFIIHEHHFVRHGAKVIIDMRQKKVTKIKGQNYHFRIILMNSYDTTTSFVVHVGFFRQICSNGMGTWFGGKINRRIIHAGKEVRKNVSLVVAALKEKNYYVNSFGEMMQKLSLKKIKTDKEAKRILKNIKLSDRMIKHVIEEWKKKENFSKDYFGLFNGITSFYTRKIESAEKNTGNKVLSANYHTDKILQRLMRN